MWLCLASTPKLATRQSATTSSCVGFKWRCPAQGWNLATVSQQRDVHTSRFACYRCPHLGSSQSGQLFCMMAGHAGFYGTSPSFQIHVNHVFPTSKVVQWCFEDATSPGSETAWIMSISRPEKWHNHQIQFDKTCHLTWFRPWFHIHHRRRQQLSFAPPKSLLLLHKKPSEIWSLVAFENVEGLSISSKMGRGSVLARRKPSCFAMTIPTIKKSQSKKTWAGRIRARKCDSMANPPPDPPT